MPLLANTADAGDVYEASCTIAEAIGDLVYTAGAGPIVRKADIDNAAAMPAVAIVVSKPTTTTCVVQASGPVEVPGIVPGSVYFVGTDSKPTSTRPANPAAGKRGVQFVGFGRDSDLLDLRPATLPVRIIP